MGDFVCVSSPLSSLHFSLSLPLVIPAFPPFVIPAQAGIGSIKSSRMLPRTENLKPACTTALSSCGQAPGHTFLFLPESLISCLLFYTCIFD